MNNINVLLLLVDLHPSFQVKTIKCTHWTKLWDLQEASHALSESCQNMSAWNWIIRPLPFGFYCSGANRLVTQSII